MFFICPYCHTRAVPAPPDSPRPHARCGQCFARPRAKITHTHTGILISYVKDGRKPDGEKLVQKTVKIYERQAAQHVGNLSEAVRLALDALTPVQQAVPGITLPVTITEAHVDRTPAQLAKLALVRERAQAWQPGDLTPF